MLSLDLRRPACASSLSRPCAARPHALQALEILSTRDSLIFLDLDFMSSKEPGIKYKWNLPCLRSYLEDERPVSTSSQEDPHKDTYMTSSSSFVKKVIAVPCLPARPVRPIETTCQLSFLTDHGDKTHTNTVHICLNCVRHLVIYDQLYVRNIDTTAGKICRNEDIGFPGTKGLQCSFSLLLVLSGV